MPTAATLLLAGLLLAGEPQPATLFGTVRVEGSGEPISRATVRLAEGARAVLTDQRGYFVLRDLPAGEHRLQVRALGYAPYEAALTLAPGSRREITVTLITQPLALAGVDVQGVREAARETGPGPTQVSAAAIRSMPGIAEPDVLRSVQALPSVVAASDFSSALYVRGGSPDQTAVTLDGVPLFNPYHLGGLFGAIDPDAVAEVEVWPGALGAGSEDRLSGVVAIRTREGGRDRVRGQGGVGLISSRATLDGPLPGAGGSYLLSVRRSYLDLVTEAARRLRFTDYTLPYALTDLYLKATHDVGRAGSLSAATYLGVERFRLPERMRHETGGTMDFGWGSRMATLAYRHLLSPTLQADARVAVSEFRGDFDAFEDRFHGPIEVGQPLPPPDHVLHAASRAHDLLAEATLLWHGPAHRLRGGIRIDGYRFDHRVRHSEPEGGFIPEFDYGARPSTVALHLEDEWRAGESLRLRGGMRVLNAGPRGTAWMPRAGASWTPAPSLTLTLGAGRYAQIIQSLRDEEAMGASLLAYDFPAAVARDHGLSLADDLVAGAEWRGGTGTVRVEGFLKRFSRLPLPPVPPGGIVDAPMLVPDGFREAAGGARGAELLVRQGWGGGSATIAYAYTRNHREVEGERFTPRFERRHTLDVQASLPPGWWGSASTRLQLGTGQPYTPVDGVAVLHFRRPDGGFWRGPPILLLGDHNSARLPGYARLDAGTRWSLRRSWRGRDGHLEPYLQVLNLLNTRNVLVAMPDLGFGGGPPVLNYAPQLPFFPTFGVEWRW